MEYDIITLGSATQDIFMSSKNLKVIESEKFITKKGLCVPLGSKMKVDSVHFAMGGCGTNAAVTFARQGLKTAYLGLVGKDYPGQMIKDELAAQGVSTDLLIETDKYPTAFSVILSLPETERSILKKLGACHEMTEQDIPFEKIKTKWIYAGSLSGEAYKSLGALFDFAVENKIKIAASPVGESQLGEGLEKTRALLDKVDILIVNQEEASLLTQVDFKNEEEIFKKLDKLVKGIAVMTKGPEGVVVSDGKKIYSAGIPKSGLVDRTGAGDAFSAAFVAGWIEKEDISYAIQLATANATSVVQKMGATNGLLKRGEWGEWEKVKVVIH
ncbi:carbohydrate kinase family protein [Patescibacteria group bacterium]|nr:carbohydrate kinase family protein [Patescibacteria group bacterium]MBU2579351.1 carbohydrate kinase family protein [Patescibacteria group bacterium]